MRRVTTSDQAVAAGHGGPREIDEDFRTSLDPAVWTAAYLPAWSSRTDARAFYALAEDGLHLRVPAEHPRWCPDLHEPPLRVSAVQSGSWSGPVGSSQGQQPFRDGLVVTEEQPPVWGFTPRYGRVEVESRAVVGLGSMFSAWLVGLEDVPERSGEICLVEVFGSTVGVGTDGTAVAAVGPGCTRPATRRCTRTSWHCPPRSTSGRSTRTPSTGGRAGWPSPSTGRRPAWSTRHRIIPSS